MYGHIKHHTHTQQSTVIKCIEISIDLTIPWNSISSSLAEDK